MTDSDCFFSRKYSCGVQCRMLYTLIFISELHQKLAPTKHQRGCICPLIVWAGWQSCPLRVWAGWQFCPVRMFAGWQFYPLRMLAGWQFCPLRVWAGWQSISHPFLVSELVEVFPATHRRWLNIIRRGEILLPPNSGHLGFELSGIPQNAPFCFCQVILKKNVTRIVSIFQYSKMSKELSRGCSSQDILLVGCCIPHICQFWYTTT